MGRRSDADRHNKTQQGLFIRLDPDLHDALRAAAHDRDVSATWLVRRAIEEFLPRLIPVDELFRAKP